MTNSITGIEEIPCRYIFVDSPLHDELQAQGVTKDSGDIFSVATFMCHEKDLARRPYISNKLTRPDLLAQCAINFKLEEYRQYMLTWLNGLS